MPIMDLYCCLPFQLSIFSNVGPFLDVINPHSPRFTLDFLPSINPSMMLTNKFQYGLLTIFAKE